MKYIGMCALFVFCMYKQFSFGGAKTCENGECCFGYRWDTETRVCVECGVGYVGPNCSMPCPPPFFGPRCNSTCNCSHESCHFANGCEERNNSKVGRRRSHERGSEQRSTPVLHLALEEKKVTKKERITIDENSFKITIAEPGPLRECCSGYRWDAETGKCVECDVGYMGPNCSLKCPPPFFGPGCTSECNCSNESCHYAYGCDKPNQYTAKIIGSQIRGTKHRSTPVTNPATQKKVTRHGSLKSYNTYLGSVLRISIFLVTGLFLVLLVC